MATYQALDASRVEIRLLTLQSGSYDEPLRCQLNITSLTTTINYNALSYVWGDHVSSASMDPGILLNGDHFPVTPNLYSALRHLRAPAGSDSTVLWVDAVCINQNDVDERNQQVAMMRDIYASATQVTIWLGEADEDSNVVFDALPIVTGSIPWPDQGIQCVKIRQHCGRFFFSLSDHRSWFSRVWILQELAMSKTDPDVVCGYKRAPWSKFVAAWQSIARKALVDLGTRVKEPSADAEESADQHDKIEILSLTKLDVLHDLRCAIQTRGGDSLKRLLMMSRTSAATDPRDRIYGLLGLLSNEALDPSTSNTISVDYRKSCSEVYVDAVAHIFSRGEGPYFLSGVFLSGGPATAPQIPTLPASKVQDSLPSWVPDFSRQESHRIAQPGGWHFHPPTTMHVSGAGQGAKNGKVLGDGRTLQVEGLIVDTVSDVAEFGSSLDAVKQNLSRFETIASTARMRPCSFPPLIKSHMLKFRESEPLWRTLVSNKHQKSGYEPAPASYEAMYSDLLANDITNTGEQVHEPLDSSKTSEYEQILDSCAGKKSFFTTINGFVGSCVPAGQPGDIIAILFGSPSPFVLRPLPVKQKEQHVYWLIGASYVGGIMDGEMVDELYCEDLMDSTTFLVK
ncbi:hypothetical protein HBH71_119550 [Parastagonospora nodorum]|nr:hypothetical protein HBH71_119550 [Parastagonospora nodorum]